MKAWTQNYAQTRKLSIAMAIAVLLASCGKHPKTFSPTATDTFTFHSIDTYAQAGKLYQADYLFVMDTSYSLFGNTTALTNSIRTFITKLDSANVDYRIGFAEAGIQSTCPKTSGKYNSSCVSGSFLGGVISKADSYSTKDSKINSVISRIAQSLNPDVPVPLEAVDKILKNQGASFLRPAAQLVIVMIADDEDESSSIYGVNGGTSASDYANKFKSYKANPAYVTARAIVYDTSCPTSIPGSSIAARVKSAALSASFIGTGVVQCLTQSFDTSLENLAINVTVQRERFVLQQAAVPGTVQVMVGPSLGSLSLQTLSTNYNFASASNEVVFTAGSIPDFGDAIQFSYEPILRLASNPNPSTIQVFVNGSEVPRSSSNGFTYISGENRIMLWGSAAVQDASLRVTYQLAQ